MGGTIFLIIWIAVTSWMIYTMYTRGKRAISIFPSLDESKFPFVDKRASGYSNKSFKTKVGGAQNSLHVIVTDSELWLKSTLLLASFSKYSDLLHRIPLSKIIDLAEKKNFLDIEFINEKDERKLVSLKTKNNKQLARLLKPN